MNINQVSNKYIAISSELRDKLNSLKVVPRESYDDVIRRVINMPKRIIKNE